VGIITRKVTEATCDHCNEEISTGHAAGFVDAMTYGAAFHPACWEMIGGPRVARVLCLDEICYRGGSKDGEHAWGPRT
jgi:hypothetical protein